MPAAPEPEPATVDPVAASPDVFKLILDGERMRVLEATWQPGQRDHAHGHPTLVAYAITPIHGLAYDDDGQAISIRIPQGRVMHQAPVASHAFENRSKEVAKLLIVELKPGQPRAPLPKDAAPDPLTASPDNFELISFDAQVRVFMGTWKPKQKDDWHAHPAFAAYAVTDVVGKVHNEDGTSRDVNLKAGTAMFGDWVKSHRFENLGAIDAKLLIIEQRK